MEWLDAWFMIKKRKENNYIGELNLIDQDWDCRTKSKYRKI